MISLNRQILYAGLNEEQEEWRKAKKRYDKKFQRANDYVQWKYESNRTHQRGFSANETILLEDNADGDMLKAAKKLEHLKLFLSPRIWRLAPSATIVDQIKHLIALLVKNAVEQSTSLTTEPKCDASVSDIFSNYWHASQTEPNAATNTIIVRLIDSETRQCRFFHLPTSAAANKIFDEYKKKRFKRFVAFYNYNTLMSDMAFCSRLIAESGLSIASFRPSKIQDLAQARTDVTKYFSDGRARAQYHKKEKRKQNRNDQDQELRELVQLQFI